MSIEKTYQCYVYLAGLLVPYIDFTINSQYGQISSLQLNIPYSPYISHIFPFTKVQVFEVLSNSTDSHAIPTLEFDGVVCSISRHKDVLGQVSISLTCYTDGFIWDRRKQYDFYISELSGTAPAVATGNTFNERADGLIMNYFKELIEQNNFDVGLAAASVLTSTISQQIDGEGNATSYGATFHYNGHRYIEEPNENKQGSLSPNPVAFYDKYLTKYALKYKVYGIATSSAMQNYFQTTQFIAMISKNMQDLHGENSFFAISQQILNFGFYQLFDITNPCFIPAEGDDPTVNLTTDFNINDKENNNPLTDNEIEENIALLRVNDTRQSSGLAEYIFKPISILGIPLERNVIWPDQVLSETLTYDFGNTPTRVIAHRQPWYATMDASTSLLSTATIAGPIFDMKKSGTRQYFESLVPGTVVNAPGQLRNDKIYSDYEKAYGIKYSRIDLSNAFDETLLGKTFADTEGVGGKHAIGSNRGSDDPKSIQELGKKFNNFMNYEYSVKYFGSRQYHIQVTPDTNCVIGLPTVIMDMHGQHVVAFVVSLSKYYSIRGQKNISVGIQYPRYYYENVGALGNLIDPTSADPDSMKEMAVLFGSKPLIVPNGSEDSSTRLQAKIDSIFDQYNKDKSNNKENIKELYKPKNICTLNNFLNLHSSPEVTSLPTDLQLFDSSAEENKLSTNHFTIYDGKMSLTKYTPTPKDTHNSSGLPNKTIIQYHLNWREHDQRI